MRLLDGTIRPGMKDQNDGDRRRVSRCSNAAICCRSVSLREELCAVRWRLLRRLHQKVSDTRVGDTVTGAMKIRRRSALPGYRPARPMVSAVSTPEDGSKYPDLRDALEKLQLNDAALSFDPESSVALGYGFRCGFLGLLHMDIITERLEREWDLNLVTTAPSVIYRITKTDGTVLMCDNPMALPPIGEIAMMEEPFVHAEIFTPQDSVGTIMDLCQDRRGIFLDMQYEGTRVKLNYDIPLNEIIFDFFDQIKSRSRGYASFDYEFKDYRESQLVKLDILLNGEICDAFSIIVHRDKAYGRGRSICEKLKDVIPRQMFEIPIQAAIGGKVIARETVKAMRKDVLAKCYGGDISRKKKLLEKQKEGKKRMRALGTVQMPTEAFMAVLKLDEEKYDQAARPLGLYLHIPFCMKKCAYCDFYSVTDASRMDAYTDALIRSIREYGEKAQAARPTRSTSAAARRRIWAAASRTHPSRGP